MDDNDFIEFDDKLYLAIQNASSISFQLNEDNEIFDAYCNLRNLIINAKG